MHDYSNKDISLPVSFNTSGNIIRDKRPQSCLFLFRKKKMITFSPLFRKKEPVFLLIVTQLMTRYYLNFAINSSVVKLFIKHSVCTNKFFFL